MSEVPLYAGFGARRGEGEARLAALSPPLPPRIVL